MIFPDGATLPADGSPPPSLDQHQGEQIDSFVKDVRIGSATAESKIVYGTIDRANVGEVETALEPHFLEGHHLDQGMRVIDGGVVKKVLRDHGADDIPLTPTDLARAAPRASGPCL